MVMEREDIFDKFELEFKQLTNNVRELLEKVTENNTLLDIYDDSLAECKNISDECRMHMTNIDGVPLKYLVREMNFYNTICVQERGDQKPCKTQRLLNAGGIILKSITQNLQNSKLKLAIDIIQEIRQIYIELFSSQ